LRRVKERVMEKFGLNEEDVEMSMGMTGDYNEAIKHGSNGIRIGTKIFGSRDNLVEEKKE